MDPVVVIQHEPQCPPDLLGTWLAAAGLDVLPDGRLRLRAPAEELARAVARSAVPAEVAEGRISAAVQIKIDDMDALAAHPPTIVRDLPAGGRRLMQTATGYRHTFKHGTETFADGEHTGAMPGALVRGARPSPN